MLLEHLGNLFAGFVEGFLDRDDLLISLFFGPLDLHQNPVGPALADQFPLFGVGSQLFGYPLPGSQVLPVLVGQLYIGNICPQDTHPIPLHLPVEVLLHIFDITAPQIIGGGGLDQAAALPDGVLHRAAEHHVEVAGADVLDKFHGVDDPELQEKFNRLQGHILPGGGGQNRGRIGNFGRGIDNIFHLLPGPP